MKAVFASLKTHKRGRLRKQRTIVTRVDGSKFVEGEEPQKSALTASLEDNFSEAEPGVAVAIEPTGLSSGLLKDIR